MSDLGNILQSDDELNEAQLKKYLSGEANAEELHAVEKTMADDAFVNDAVEGLQSFSSEAKLDDYVTQLNKKLHQQLETPRERKKKRRIKDLSWVILAVIIILLLCILAVWIIRMQRERLNKENTLPKAEVYKTPQKKGIDNFIV
jgi:anti-sigma factor RsiW